MGIGSYVEYSKGKVLTELLFPLLMLPKPARDELIRAIFNVGGPAAMIDLCEEARIALDREEYTLGKWVAANQGNSRYLIAELIGEDGTLQFSEIFSSALDFGLITGRRALEKVGILEDRTATSGAELVDVMRALDSVLRNGKGGSGVLEAGGDVLDLAVKRLAAVNAAKP